MRIRLPMPHPGQQLVLEQAKRFNHLCAGRRWRKTTLCMAIAVENSVYNKTIIWGAPTYQQARVGFEETKYATAGTADFNEARMTATFPTGGRIIYRTLDKPDNARGLSADGVVIDEAQAIKPEAFFEVLRPMLIDTNGWAWLIGTSNGHDWWWGERQLAKMRSDNMTWNVPTLGVTIGQDGNLIRSPHPYENPYISFDEISTLFHSLPKHTFKREILSDDEAQAEGIVYDTWLDGYPERIDGNVTEEADYIPGGGGIYWGVDDGYSAGSRFDNGLDPVTRTWAADAHPRVIGFYQLRPNGQLCRFEELYRVKMVEEEQVKEALELGYPLPDYAAVDSSAAQLRGRLHQLGIATRKATHQVDEGIKELRRWISPDANGFRRLLVHPRCRHFRSEMASYSYDNDKGKPIKQFDHGPDEARYITWCLRYE